MRYRIIVFKKDKFIMQVGEAITILWEAPDCDNYQG